MNKKMKLAGILNIISGILFIIVYFAGAILLADLPTGGWGGLFLFIFSFMFWPVVCILPASMIALGATLFKKQKMDFGKRCGILVMILIKGNGIFLHCGTIQTFFNRGELVTTIFGVVQIITILIMAISIFMDIPALFARKKS